MKRCYVLLWLFHLEILQIRGRLDLGPFLKIRGGGLGPDLCGCMALHILSLCFTHVCHSQNKENYVFLKLLHLEFLQIRGWLNLGPFLKKKGAGAGFGLGGCIVLHIVFLYVLCIFAIYKVKNIMYFSSYSS